MARKALCVFLTLLSLFLIGTVVVLTAVVSYFGVDSRDVITEAEMRLYERLAQAADLNRQPIPFIQEVMIPAEAGNDLKGDFISTKAMKVASYPREDKMEDGVERLRNFKREVVTSESGMNITRESTSRQRIPKIVHQTWKSEILPERWEIVRQECMNLHPD